MQFVQKLSSALSFDPSSHFLARCCRTGREVAPDGDIALQDMLASAQLLPAQWRVGLCQLEVVTKKSSVCAGGHVGQHWDAFLLRCTCFLKPLFCTRCSYLDVLHSI